MARQRRTLARAHACEQLERVHDASIGGNLRRGNDGLGLGTSKHRLRAPLGILVAKRPELTLVETAW
jgi:hypothetical protein